MASPGTALWYHVASTGSKSRRRGTWEAGSALVACPPSGALLPALLWVVIGRGSRQGVGVTEWCGADGASQPGCKARRYWCGVGIHLCSLSPVWQHSTNETSVSADVDDLSKVSLIHSAFWKVSVRSQTAAWHSSLPYGLSWKPFSSPLAWTGWASRCSKLLEPLLSWDRSIAAGHAGWLLEQSVTASPKQKGARRSWD